MIGLMVNLYSPERVPVLPAHVNPSWHLTAVGAVSSAVAVHAASRRWLQLFSLGIEDFMKIAPLLIGACLLSVLDGCHKPQASETIRAAEATIKATALASITAKHSEVSSADLKFSDLRIRALPDGKEEIFVTYELPATAKTTTEGKKATTTTRIHWSLDVSIWGGLECLQSSIAETYNVAQ